MNPNNPAPEPSGVSAPTVNSDGLQTTRAVQVQAAVLLLLMLGLLVAVVLFVLNARGYFERNQTVVLVADDSEGVTVGMDMTFSGFRIGRVSRIELSPKGKAHIIVTVPEKDAKWLRASTVFTLERSIVGTTRIRAFTGLLEDPPLPDGAQKDVLRGDAAEDIPKLTANVKDILANISAVTNQDSALSQSLEHIKIATARLSGPNGAVGMLMGNDAEVKKVQAALDKANGLLARLDTVGAKTGVLLDSAKGVADRTDALVSNANTRVFGSSTADPSLMADTQATVKQLNGLLADARGSLGKLDLLLKDMQGTAANTREATQDLGALRTEIEASMRRVDSLINEVNRKWPFKRDAEVKLP
jgi:phospholipid/cholesterol/gamma-HCH transport system substrate-binding protein